MDSFEKHKQSIVPEIFWYFSIGGSLLLLIYALVRKDIVFIVGQSTGLLIYVRNLMLIQRQKRNNSTRLNKTRRRFPLETGKTCLGAIHSGYAGAVDLHMSDHSMKGRQDITSFNEQGEDRLFGFFSGFCLPDPFLSSSQGLDPSGADT